MNNIDKTRPPAIRTADDSSSNSTVGAGGDSSAFVVATTVEEIEELRFSSVVVGVVVPVPLVPAVVEVVFTISATWKLALMIRS